MFFSFVIFFFIVYIVFSRRWQFVFDRWIEFYEWYSRGGEASSCDYQIDFPIRCWWAWRWTIVRASVRAGERASERERYVCLWIDITFPDWVLVALLSYCGSCSCSCGCCWSSCCYSCSCCDFQRIKVCDIYTHTCLYIVYSILN